MTGKMHIALLPVGSANTYVTFSTPIPKRLPGAWDLFIKRTFPDPSVAVGGIHDTWVWYSPGGMVRLTSCGQLLTTGITWSTVTYKKKKVYPDIFVPMVEENHAGCYYTKRYMEQQLHNESLAISRPFTVLIFSARPLRGCLYTRTDKQTVPKVCT